MRAKKPPRSGEKSPDLTVITVCLRAAQALEKTVLSVLAEKRPGLEYVVVDGGSTDKTLDVLKKYRKNIDQVVSEADHGIYHAMNKGIALARGRWLLFLNAGDTLRPGMAEKMLATAESAPAGTGLVCGRVAMTDIQGAQLGYTFPAKTGDAATLAWDNCVAHQGTLIRASTFARYGLFSQGYDIAGDYEYWVRLLKAGVRFEFVEHVLVDFPEDGMSSQRSLYLKAQRECLLIRVKYGYLSLTGATARFLRLSAVFFLKNSIRGLLGDRLSVGISRSRAKAKGL